MVKKADIGSKRLISLAPDAWAKWVTQQTNVVVQDIIDAQFQWLSRDSDVLMKVKTPEEGEFLILNEIQLRYSAKMPCRMRAYAALAEEKYGLPTYPVLVNILPPAANTQIQTRYKSTFKGLQARQDYRVINLADVDVQVVFEQNLRALLPFVPVLDGGRDENLIRRAAQLLQQDPDLSELESLLGFFASFVLSTQLVAQILRWDMTVLRESPWYQEILQEGERRGKQEALQQEKALILRQLNRKLSTIPDELMTQVDNLPLEQLEDLAEALLDFSSTADLAQWLEQHS